MTLNNALSQNCVVCTMRTPRAQAARTASCLALAVPCCSAVSLRVPCRDTKIVSRYKTLLCAVWRALRVVSCALRCVATPCRALLPLAPTRLLGRTPGHACPGPACCDTTRCIATKTRKWAVAHSSLLSYTFFFFLIIFFSFVLLTIKQIIIIIIIFKFLVEP